jgi:hypothetical protein
VGAWSRSKIFLRFGLKDTSRRQYAIHPEHGRRLHLDTQNVIAFLSLLVAVVGVATQIFPPGRSDTTAGYTGKESPASALPSGRPVGPLRTTVRGVPSRTVPVLPDVSRDALRSSPTPQVSAEPERSPGLPPSRTPRAEAPRRQDGGGEPGSIPPTPPAPRPHGHRDSTSRGKTTYPGTVIPLPGITSLYEKPRLDSTVLREVRTGDTVDILCSTTGGEVTPTNGSSSNEWFAVRNGARKIAYLPRLITLLDGDEPPACPPRLHRRTHR